MERDVILEIVERARRRLGARRAWQWTGRVLLYWTALVLLLALARLVVPVTLPFVVLPAAGLAAAIIAVAALRAFWRLSPRLAAQIVDYRFALADRLTTSIEVITGVHRSTSLEHALLADTAHAALALDLRRGLPAGPGRNWLVALVLTVAALLAVYGLVGIALPGTPAHQIVQTIRREGRRLERSADNLEEQARLDRARITRRVAPDLRRLGERLQRDRLERQEALARIDALSRQIESERQKVREARRQQSGERTPPAQQQSNLPSELFKRRAAADRTVRQIQEITDRLTQSKSPQEREALMRQLAALAAGGEEGDVPLRTREQAAQAQRQLGAGDTAGARRTMAQSAADLDDLRAMLADEEGLQQAQRDLQRSSQNISQGRTPSATETEETPKGAAQPGNVAPGNRPLPQNDQPGGAEPPPGPNQGTTPGQGSVSEKLGERTARLDAERQQNRLRGLQGEGRVTTSELLGPGRTAQVRAPQGPAVAAARAGADRYMQRMRIPPEYREVVRRYFEALAAQR
jgi:hypothetical protein